MIVNGGYEILNREEAAREYCAGIAVLAEVLIAHGMLTKDEYRNRVAKKVAEMDRVAQEIKDSL